ncbi:subclass B1 metallo-beta-lactamase [Pontibacter qinzhouensis]|uniref:beta-lactamase n=1 Tax=Pontibacter qinzhouensis TaxID=2603253 RepID=A0A5C8JAJ9_9BACT|nr:subclass B1 metallo-beta-lactamase [Pontibacter qinzhouensis]TXK33744.1 subclass B1 metallo-beta-lactamase [Pontibacter qinzhouensis]
MKSLKKLLRIFLFFALAVPAYAQELKLEVKELAPQVWVHTSFGVFGGQTFPSNGLIVATVDGVLLIDTAWGEEQTEQLLNWVQENLQQPVKMCLVTHAHDDRMGGIAVLQQQQIPVLSSALTAELAPGKNLGMPDPRLAVGKKQKMGGQQFEAYFPGAGHSPDNLVVYLPKQQILFGGCLVKDVTATNLGNLADADLQSWPQAIRQLQQRYPKTKTVVPGHGPCSNTSALDHTLELLQQHTKK